MSAYTQSLLARQGGSVNAPSATPQPSVWERWLGKLLPPMLCPAWKLEELYACHLSAARDIQIRDDIQVEFFTGIEKVSPELLDLIWKDKDFLTRRLWKYRLKKRFCWLVVAFREGRPVRYTFVQYAGGGMIPYSPAMRSRSALIGPGSNVDPTVSVGEIAPYLQSWVFQQLNLRGYEWAYIGVNVENQTLRQAVSRHGAWMLVGRFLLHRTPFGRFRIRAATLGPDADAASCL